MNSNYRGKRRRSGIATSHDSSVTEEGDRGISLSLMEGREAHGR